MKKVHIRWLIRRDMEDVLRIERQCFEYFWQHNDFVVALRHRNCIGMVAEYGCEVAGYMVYELHKTRLHILNFAVAPEFSRQGVGAQMVQKLLGKLHNQRRARITLEVREYNLPAQLFWKAMGFRCVNILKDYYEDSEEDAFVFTYKIGCPCEAVS